MKLYYSPGACGLHVHMALTEAGIPFTTEKVDIKNHTYAGGDFKAINPKGYIPVVDPGNGDLWTEGQVILQRIADMHPEKNLLPKLGTPERYKAMEWLNFIATELHKGLSALFNPKLEGEGKEKVIEKIQKRLTFLNAHLEKNTYVLGSEFSLADAYLFNIVRWAAPLKVDMSSHTAILGLLERVSTRPSARAAIESEGLRR
jgi:glutathione S-transferase